MKVYFVTLILSFCFFPFYVTAQQHVVVMSRCGGVDTVIIPNIVDRDSDGMDDRLEQKLLDKFMPTIIIFSDENCPGPALDGTGDTNLIATRISPYPGQYCRSSSLDSLQVRPVPVVGAKQLTSGLIWYNTFIMVHCAVLYGQDCGALGHTADVEGFHFSLSYIGSDTLAGWMYDTVMTNWMGSTIQSVSHDGTLCQHIETRPYKSTLNPTGVDTVYSSPNKHGNYLTIGDCNLSFICNPGCNGTQIKRNCTNVNVGEPWASLVPDLGAYYPAYAGQDPWSTTNFLNGGAGTIAAKMERPLSSDFATGQTLASNQICPIYLTCYGSGSSASAYICTPDSFNFFGRQLATPGVYTHTLTSSYGCDSTISLTLSVFNPSQYSFNDSTCEGTPYSFNGQQLTVAGIYHDTLSNSNGCDSAITLTLSVIPSASHSITGVLCAGSSYNFDGRQLTAAGLYYDTIINSSGCVSYTTLSLGFDTLPVVVWNINADTFNANSHAILLIGGTPAGGYYTGAGIVGNIFYPDSAGPGAHVVTYTYTDILGCSNSTTQTLVVVATGINEIQLASAFALYPNPANDMLILQSDLLPANEITPVVYDVTGKAVFVPLQHSGNRITFNISGIAAGMYSVRFSVNGSLVSKKFVKGE